MIQVDLPVAFGSGTLLAAALEHHTSERTWPYLYQRGLARNLIFQTLFALWLPVYLLVNYFGFQTSHMFWHGESLTDYPALLPLFLIDPSWHPGKIHRICMVRPECLLLRLICERA